MDETPEINIMRLIQLAAPKLGVTLFRNNVGTGFVGKTIRIFKPTTMTLMPGDVVVRNARPLHSGLCKGSSDLIGFDNAGRFLAVEVKALTGKTSSEQENFLSVVNKNCGLGFIARSVEDFITQLKK